MKKCRLFLLTVLLLSGTGLWAQAVGDYGSNNNGNWGIAGTWVVCQTAGQWTDAIAATNVPTTSTTVNFWIRAGHTVNVESSPKYANNITIEATGKLSSDGALPSTVRYMRMSGSTLTVNGQLGSGATDGLGLYALGGANQTITITGTGTSNISRFQPQATGQSLIIDSNVQFNYAGSSGTGSTSLYPNAFDNFTITINPGKTLTTANNSYLSIHGSSGTSAGAVSMTINVNGTFNASGANSTLNLNTAAGKTVTLNVGPNGIVNANGPIRAHYTNAGTTNINVASGGQINCLSTGLVGLSKSTITNNGSISLQGAIADSIGNVVSGGTIEFNKSAGNVALCSAATINGGLTLTQGNLVLGANNLTVGTTGSITCNPPTTYIVTNGAGKLIQNAASATAKLFPVGASVTSYDPVTLTPTDATDFAVNVGTTLPAPAPANFTYNAKVWNITPVTPSSTIVTLTPSVTEATITSDVIGQYITDSYVNTVASKSGNTYTATFNTFSPFVCGTTDLGTGMDQSLFNDVMFDGSTIHNNSNKHLQVYDIAGRKVISSDQSVSMSFATKGVYIVKYDTKTLKIVLK